MKTLFLLTFIFFTSLFADMDVPESTKTYTINNQKVYSYPDFIFKKFVHNANYLKFKDSKETTDFYLKYIDKYNLNSDIAIKTVRMLANMYFNKLSNFDLFNKSVYNKFASKYGENPTIKMTLNNYVDFMSFLKDDKLSAFRLLMFYTKINHSDFLKETGNFSFTVHLMKNTNLINYILSLDHFLQEGFKAHSDFLIPENSLKIENNNKLNNFIINQETLNVDSTSYYKKSILFRDFIAALNERNFPLAKEIVYSINLESPNLFITLDSSMSDLEILADLEARFVHYHKFFKELFSVELYFNAQTRKDNRLLP